jgi:hypothetical protein
VIEIEPRKHALSEPLEPSQQPVLDEPCKVMGINEPISRTILDRREVEARSSFRKRRSCDMGQGQAPRSSFDPRRAGQWQR